MDARRREPAYAHLERLVRTAMSDMGIPGMAIAVTDRQRLVWSGGYGVADIASRHPVTRDTRFEIGSLGKPFTVVVLMQLREQGRIDVHEPVERYLPWFRVQSEHAPITVHHLLNHTAGIPRGTDIAPHGLFEAWALRERRTTAPPGEYFSYSNIGYKTLGFLVERLTGQSLGDVIQSRVLDPLAMRHTHATTTAEFRPHSAIGYTSIYDDRPEHLSHPLAPAIWTEYGTGDGAQVSTVGDMAIYLRFLLNRGRGEGGRLVSEESFTLMTENGIWTGADDYAYGLASYAVEGRRYIGHGGGNAGFRSALVVDMEAGLGVVLLANRMGDTDPLVEVAQQALSAVRVADQGDPLPAFPPRVDPTAIEDAVDFEGTYREGRRVLRLVAEGGQLLLVRRGRKVPLETRGGDRFYAQHADFQSALLEFCREDGRVVEAFHGPAWYVHDRYTGPTTIEHPPEWEMFTGHYRTRSPELSNFRVVVRKGQLVLLNPWGDTSLLVPSEEMCFRIGTDPQSPETLRFDAVVDGYACRAEYSGCPYYRALTP